ncbi:MAG: COG1470 family protein, partial [Anaerolineales bacterium]
YLHNSPGLSVSKAIKFIRPAATDWRVKVYPDYRSSFTVKRQARLDFTVRNTGNNAEADVFDMSFSSVSPGWSLTLYAGDGKTPLADTDGDGVVDTGSQAPGADFPVVVKVVAPETALAGDYTAPSLTVTSSRNPGRSASIKLQIAIPAPFAQASLDLMVGANVRLIWKENLYGTNLSQGQQFTGSNLSLVALPDKNYIYTWEHNTGMMANLEYTILNRFGGVLKPVTKLTDNSQSTYDTADRFLSLASTLNGRIGAIWVRTLSRDSDQKVNQNIYFAILDSVGNLVVNPVNLTQNSLWRGRDDYDVPMYLSPRIVASEDGKFVLAWGDERNHAAGSSADMYYTVYNQSGDQTFPITALTSSVAGEVRYTTPSLVALPGSRVVFVYIVMDPGDPMNPQDDISTAAYVVVNSAGGLAKSQTLIAGSTGSTPDGVLTSGGKVVYGWNLTGSAQVQYVLMDSQTLDVTSGPHSLSTPKGREASVVSVTMDKGGHAILTWGDAEQSDYLSYVLVDENGGNATPPMIFATGLGNEPLINTNSYGLGNAVYDGSWQVQLPYMQR